MTDIQKPLSEYNVGDIYKGETITTLYSAKHNYLIFEGDNCGDVTVATSDSHVRKQCSEISPRISIITEYLVTKNEKRKFVDQIGLAYSEAVEGNVDNAKKICDKLIDRIELYKSNVGRFYYLLSCLSIVIFVSILSYVFEEIESTSEITVYLSVISFASIGGFLSVAKDIKKINIDSSDFGWFQVFYGGIRILISILSGLIIYILIKSDLILSNLNAQNNSYVIYVFAIIAGFSESMIPNLLKKVEDKKTEQF